MKSLLAAIAVSFFSTTVVADALYEELPSKINPDERYVFYSHGLIVEGSDETPRHPEYGIYDFPSIKQALFGIGGFNLVAHHRPLDTDVDEYVSLLESWVRSLLQAGVDATDITLIGFSRGGHITALTASQLQDYEINTVLIATCFDGDIEANPPIHISGRLLSIYESSDSAGPCEKLAARSEVNSFDEINITTGKKHGAFYTPSRYWINPIREWLQRIDN